MSAIQLIALASTVSLLAGWRLYFVTFAVGLSMKLGWVALPQQLHALDALANNWIIGIAALGAVAEFFADKIAWVDSLWDAVHSVVRPLGGALLAMAIVDCADPGLAGRKFPFRRCFSARRPCRKGGCSNACQRKSGALLERDRLDRRGCCNGRPARPCDCQSNCLGTNRARSRDPVDLARTRGEAYGPALS